MVSLLCYIGIIYLRFQRASRHHTHEFSFWVVTALVFGFASIILAKERVFRVFVCMDSGRYEVAKYEGDDFRPWSVRIKDAERKARMLAEEIRSKIPDQA